MSDGSRDRLERLRRIAAATPDDPRAAYFLGHEYLRAECWAEAEATYRRYLDLEPDDEGVGWKNLAFAVARQGRIEEAEALYARAVEAALEHDHEELAAEIRGIMDDR